MGPRASALLRLALAATLVGLLVAGTPLGRRSPASGKDPEPDGLVLPGARLLVGDLDGPLDLTLPQVHTRPNLVTSPASSRPTGYEVDAVPGHGVPLAVFFPARRWDQVEVVVRGPAGSEVQALPLVAFGTYTGARGAYVPPGAAPCVYDRSQHLLWAAGGQGFRSGNLHAHLPGADTQSQTGHFERTSAGPHEARFVLGGTAHLRVDTWSKQVWNGTGFDDYEAQVAGLIVYVQARVEDPRLCDRRGVQLELSIGGALLARQTVLAFPHPDDLPEGDAVEPLSAGGGWTGLLDGGFAWDTQLFAAEGPGLPAVLDLHYRSHASAYWRTAWPSRDRDEVVSAPFGQGWSSLLSVRLLLTRLERSAARVGTGQARPPREVRPLLVDADGRLVPFVAAPVAGRRTADLASGTRGQWVLSAAFGVPTHQLVLEERLSPPGWVLSAFEGPLRATFDRAGELVELRRRDHGRPLTLSRTGPPGVARSTTVTDSQGRTFVLSEKGGLVRSVVDPARRTWAFDYEGRSLVELRHSSGLAWRFERDPATWLLTRIVGPGQPPTDVGYMPPGPDNRFAAGTVARVVQGKVTADLAWHALGSSYRDAFSLEVRRPLRRVVGHSFAPLLGGWGWSAAYGSLALHRRELDPSGLTVLHDVTPMRTSRLRRLVRDARGRVLSVQHPDGSLEQTIPGPGAQVLATVDRANRRTDVTYTRTAGAEDLLESIELPEARPGRGRARTTFRYDADGDLVEATDPLGVTTERVRSTKAGLQGLVLTETRRAAGMAFPPPEERFQYDDMGHVVEHAGPEGETTRWTYDDLDRLTSVTAPDGTTQRWIWSRTSGLLERIEAPGGASISYAYDADGQVASEADPDGTTTYRRDAFGDVVDEQRGTEGWSRPRDALGRVTGVFQRSVALGSSMPTFLTYDALGNVLREECHVPGGQLELTETRYDAFDRIESVRLPTVLDAQGNPTNVRPELRYTYTRSGQLRTEAVEIRPGAFEGAEYVHDALDRVIRIRRGPIPGGPFLEEELDYDLAGQATTQRGDIAPLATTVVRTRTRTVATVERDPLGRAVMVRDTAGQVLQEVERDRSGRVVLVRAPDSSGQLVRVQERRFDRRTGQLDELIDDRGRSLRLFYDGAGRLARTVDPLGGEHRREYDVAGRVTREARLGADGSSEVVERRYSPEGWLAEEAQVEGSRRATTRYEHDARGRLVRRVDPLGQVTTWVHDDRDQIVERTTPRGTTKFSYDVLGRLVRTSSWTGEWVEVRWDLAGRPLREENAEFAQDYVWGPWSDVERITTTEKRSGRARAVALGYDQFGLLETVTDPEGVVTRHVHDSENRIVELHQGGVLRGRFGRDVAGRITTWQTPAGEQRREYDGPGRLLRQRSARPAHAIEYAYDALGRRERAEYQHLGLAIAWTYDGLSRLTSERVTDARGSTLHHEQLAWDGRGNRLWRARNGVREDYRHDAFNQLEEVRGVELRELPAASATSTSALDSSTVADRAIDGRRTVASVDGFVSASTATDHTLTVELQGIREVAVIDLELPTDHGLPRALKLELRDAIGSWRDADVLTYLGSRPLATPGSGPVTPGVVPAQAAMRLVLRPAAATAVRVTQPRGAAPLGANPNHPEALAIAELRALAAIPRAESFQYDGSGNLLQAGARAFEWDAEDRLLAVREPGVVDRAFAWGPTGLLLREEDRQGRTETGHVYLNEELLASYDAQGAPTGKVLRGPTLDRQLGVVPYPGGVAGEAQYLYAGALGTPHLVQAESGAVVETHVSSAWGEPVALPGTTDPAGRRAAFTFTGLRSLPGTGLLDARARFYAPAWGRFLSADPSGTEDGLNRFAWAHGNPVSFTDPDGRNVVSEAVGLDDIGAGVRLVNAEWQSGSRGTAVLAGVATAAITVDAIANVVPGVGQGKALLKRGLVWLGERGARHIGLRLAREVAEEGAQALAKHADDIAQHFKECRGGCFLAGALVETPTGRRPIESIHVGDEVLSRDERTGEVGCREVRQTFEGRASSFVRIGLLSSETGSGQTLRCTAEHPLRVVDHGWVTAGALRVGDRLVSSSGAALDVVLVQVVVEDVGYFNLEVEGTHTYFVAGEVNAPAVWVHNLGCGELAARSEAFHARAVEKQRFVQRVFDSARSPASVGKGANPNFSRAQQKLQRRHFDPDSSVNALWRGIDFKSASATDDLVLSILQGERHGGRFVGTMKMADPQFLGQRGIAIFDQTGRGVLVRESDSSFITFLEQSRGLGNIFHGH